MKKVDKLILSTFIWPFLLTTILAIFILLIQFMLKYFDDFVGKGLGFVVLVKLIIFFSMNVARDALPLGVLVSSLMTYGNLGQHFELTAIKGAGISLVRTLRPIFFFVVVLSLIAFYFNDRIVPVTNLKAYSLLYDIKKKKPSFDLNEGQFYNGIPGYSIKVNKKFPNGFSLKDVIIYDHSNPKSKGNSTVILADSAKMYSILNDTYLKLELFDGNTYAEFPPKERREKIKQLERRAFEKMDIVMDMSSFNMVRTDEKLFAGSRLMKNIKQLTEDIDSLNRTVLINKQKLYYRANNFYVHHLDNRIDPIIPIGQLTDSASNKSNTKKQKNTKAVKEKASFFPFDLSQDPNQKIKKSRIRNIDKKDTAEYLFAIDTLFKADYKRKNIINNALNKARSSNVILQSSYRNVKRVTEEMYRHIIEKNKKYAQSFACLVMFLIGAPLGAIIKKGGLGFPVIISVVFYIIYYVINILSEKWAREGFIDGQVSVWMADALLLPTGLFFLRQARIDARLFDSDFYNVMIDKIKQFLKVNNQRK